MGRPLRLIVASGLATGAVLAVGALARVSYAPMPDAADVLNPDRYALRTVYDLLGRRVSREEAERLKAPPEGRAALSPSGGAVAIDAALVERGREAFYRETFGNEGFLSDVMGMLDGGLTPYEVARAVASLGGEAPKQVRLGWAHAGTNGGDKVPNLVGLAWSAPYLHDSGVAVGPDAGTSWACPARSMPASCPIRQTA